MAGMAWDAILDGWHWQAPQHAAWKLYRPVAETLCQLLAEGLTIGDATALANIHPRTYHRWMSEGGDDIEAGRHTMLGTVRRAIDCAKATGARAALELMRDHAQDDWRAAQWFLEHCRGDGYGKDAQPDKAPPAPIEQRLPNGEGDQ